MHEGCEGPHQLDIHHIVIQRNYACVFLAYLFVLSLFTTAFYLCFLNGTLGTIFLLSLFFSACLVKFYYATRIEKGEKPRTDRVYTIWLSHALTAYCSSNTESVVIIPAFGVQLEAHYWSGRVVRSFVPIDKIMKPVLNENVTPFTCYWSLALLVGGKKELMLAFKAVQPPVKLLVPIWRALRAATYSRETTDFPAQVDE
ncbi:uncharacterized protein LOC132191111 [Corylus avellana]|uniref:uncharacterized protein LOC132191111 n=1 Tax=Corylus avellana TaxID=13451 RepID=UPI00286B88AF|nr:uncharacterized protein LOC132191111 [Corylus avellana]